MYVPDKHVLNVRLTIDYLDFANSNDYFYKCC